MAYTEKDDQWAGARGPAMTGRVAVPVTPSDTVDLSPYAKYLYIGVSGDVVVVLAGDKGASGTPRTYKSHPIGYFPQQVRRVMLATTATDIVAHSD